MMTQKGVELTQNGEFNQSIQNVFSFNRAMGISYSIDPRHRNLSEIKMTPPDQEHLPMFQMIFVLKGEIAFSGTDDSAGCRQVESQQHNLFCIPPNCSSRLLTAAKGEIICINLSASFLNRHLPGSHPAYQELTSGLDKEKISKLSLNNLHITPEINAILQRLENLSRDGLCEQLLMESKTIELLALQISQSELLQVSNVPSQLKKEELEKMHEAREILIGHTGEKLSLRSLAHLVGTNEFHLKRNFKIAFGSTVYGYLNQYKMEEAKRMLIEGDLNVSEISGKIGYKHATHFSSAFKKYFGFLPNKIKMLWLVFDPEPLMILLPI